MTSRNYNAAGQPQTDQVAGGALDGVEVTTGYDGFLRRNSLHASRASATLSDVTYGYDTSSRLSTVTSGGLTATYAYAPTSGALATTTFSGGAQNSRGYDSLGWLQSVSSTTPSAGTVASFVYTHNNLDQRTRVTREDGSFWSYVYDDREVSTTGPFVHACTPARCGLRAGDACFITSKPDMAEGRLSLAVDGEVYLDTAPLIGRLSTPI